MFSLSHDVFRIGEKNVIAAKKSLNDLGIRILAEDVGGSVGRTMLLHTDTGEVEVRYVNRESRKI